MTPLTTYSAGEHHGLIWDCGIALVDASLPVDDAVELFQRLRPGSELRGFFAALIEVCGNTPLDLPDFAVASIDSDGCRLAARGTFVCAATVGGAVSTVSGRGVTTWSESHVPGATNVSAYRSGRQSTTEVERPVLFGVVLAGALARPLTTGTTAATFPVDPIAVPARPTSASDVPVQPPAAASTPPEVVETPSAAATAPTPTNSKITPPSDAPEPVLTEPDNADEFDDLWAEHTSFAPVESAALRPGEPESARPADAVPTFHASSSSVSSGPPSAARDVDATRVPAAEEEPDLLPTSAPALRPAEAARPAAGGLITSVPAASPSPRPAVTTDLPAVSPVPETVLPSGRRQDAAAPEDVQDDGDHDGHTVLHGPTLGPGSGSDPVAELPGSHPTSIGPSVVAVSCDLGHANPPQRTRCRVCAGPVADVSIRVSRPPLGRMITSSGETVELSGPVIAGREPRASRFRGTDVPRLVTLAHQHVSGSHVELRVEGWSVLATDLQSTNGTFLRRRGEPPVRLLGTAVLMVEGDVLDLGHGVELRFEELP